MDRPGHLDDPVFLVHEGLQYIVNIVVAAGCGRRWVPLPIAGVGLLRVAIGNGPEIVLEVRDQAKQFFWFSFLRKTKIEGDGLTKHKAMQTKPSISQR